MNKSLIIIIIILIKYVVDTAQKKEFIVRKAKKWFYIFIFIFDFKVIYSALKKIITFSGIYIYSNWKCWLSKISSEKKFKCISNYLEQVST